MVLTDEIKSSSEEVVVYGPAENLICGQCGKEYVSRGKHDPGICRECEYLNRFENAKMIGGPLDDQS